MRLSLSGPGSVRVGHACSLDGGLLLLVLDLCAVCLLFLLRLSGESAGDGSEDIEVQLSRFESALVFHDAEAGVVITPALALALALASFSSRAYCAS